MSIDAEKELDKIQPEKGFPHISASKESACNAGDLGLIRGLGKSPGEGKGYPLQYSGLENFWGLKESDITEQLSFIFTQIKTLISM